MTKEAIYSKEITQLKEGLVKKFKPKQIFLFGSHAYGSPGVESDLDICVILDLEGRRKIEWLRNIRRELADIVSSPLNILVYEPAEFGNRAILYSTLEHKILTQGIKLYEQPKHSAGALTCSMNH